MAARGPPSKGAPKTVASIRSIWNTMKKNHEAILLVTQKQYPGASGWTYDQDRSFSVGDDNKDEWKVFVKQHPIFRPFATQGWDLFDLMHDILPTRARGVNVHNPAHPPSIHLPGAAAPSPLSQINLHLDDGAETDDFFSGRLAALVPQLTDRLLAVAVASTIGDYGNSAMPTPSQLIAPPLASSQPVPTLPLQSTAPLPSTSNGAAVSTQGVALRGVIPATPSMALKRKASDHEETPWTKRGKINGPDAIMSLGRSPPLSRQPNKSQKARKLAEEEMEAGVITGEDRAILSLIFGSDPKKADAYVAEKDSEGRLTLAKILISRF
ncbi:Myb-DNA-bind-3 domain-containing protein [Mycena sanguinolenta]|uniref:Myb-DNA-bind-3 domain-containing protein n=1 Tax=Mycena sanguinolenta TaxID=230812 RepID=A0A8H7CQR0_9AGAR|nr:Myb-DNA-bind-3 domain-containing protein [Mycena sanguinolenta]